MRLLLPTGFLILAVSCSSEQTTIELPSSSGISSEPQNPEAVEAAVASGMTEINSGLYSLNVNTLEGEALDLSAYEGKVTLVVNVASKCGYTRQYDGLQQLHTEFEDQGFAVLGFPSNEFGGQEPGSADEIRQFCTEGFDVSFPMFAKSEVKAGEGQSPVYSFLEEQTGEVPGWNFCKYLVGKDGQVIAFYKSGVEPDAAELRKAIEAAFG
ncbi:MAG: glutathione peroxidase [Planctomycetota bacterium]|jgi:glutathione peroxidase